MKQEMFLENEKGLILIAQLSKDRKLCPLAEKCFAIKDGEIYKNVCCDNHKFCMSFLENNPISEKDYNSGNYIIEVIKDEVMFSFSGGAA